MTLLRRLVIILPMVALVPSIINKSSNNNNSINHPLLFVSANAPPPSSSSRDSRFTRKRSKSKPSSDASAAAASDGLTLGDLEALQQQSNNHGGGAFIPSEVLFGQQHHQHQQREPLKQSSAPAEHESTTSSSGSSSSSEQTAHHQTARRTSLRRINLDLSGRVMCHVLSPPKMMQNNNDLGDGNDNDRPAVQMESMPLFEATSSSSSSLPLRRFDSKNNNNKITLRRKRFQRHNIIPHVYLGANYDLDEIWYGATRWIAKCSWCLPNQQSKLLLNDESNKSVARQLLLLFAESIFPTGTAVNKRSAWRRLDLEREQSVFEHLDSTTRVRVVQQSSNHPSTDHAVQQLSVEYDSAKYSNIHHHDVVDNLTTTTTPRLVQAPTISVNVQTPILHPRIELRTKKTWIVQNGGDTHGNHYGGTHYDRSSYSSSSSSSSPVERRLESIRDGYRAMVPRSQLLNVDDGVSTSSSSSSMSSATAMDRLQSIGRKLSNWLEQDGWMPKRVTTDLMGNFVSVNEVGFSFDETTNNKDSNNDNNNYSNNMGIRLRISKRIDWTSLGIFPWSSNSNNPNHPNNSLTTTPTRVRLDVCGLHNSGNSQSQIGCEFDPLCLGDTFKVVIGHDGVGV